MITSALDPKLLHASTITALATALERLVVRVTQDLDPDASEGAEIDDPAWAATHAKIVAVARDCAVVLDNPTVVSTLLADYACATEAASGPVPSD